MTGGLYKYVRNPQYTAFAIMGFGVLLVWPRFTVLVMLVIMLFVYYFLAKKEEKECEEKFGEEFRAYVNKTAMFVPWRFRISGKHSPFGRSRHERILANLVIFALVMAAFLGGAFALRNYAIASISTLPGEDAIAISTTLMSKQDMAKIMETALAHPEVNEKLKHAGYGSGTKLLNYIVPLDWILADLPLEPIPAGVHGHVQPKQFAPDKFKVLFTKAEFAADAEVRGKEILKKTISRKPIIVVKVNKATDEITALETPPPHVLWGDIPTPSF